MKHIAIAVILSIALIVSALFIKLGMENSSKFKVEPAFDLYGYEGILYRLNTVNGRLDVLVPSNEAVLLFPVGQIQLPNQKDVLTQEQKTSLSNNFKVLSQYIQSERARSLRLLAKNVPEKP